MVDNSNVIDWKKDLINRLVVSAKLTKKQALEFIKKGDTTVNGKSFKKDVLPIIEKGVDIPEGLPVPSAEKAKISLTKTQQLMVDIADAGGAEEYFRNKRDGGKLDGDTPGYSEWLEVKGFKEMAESGDLGSGEIRSALHGWKENPTNKWQVAEEEKDVYGEQDITPEPTTTEPEAGRFKYTRPTEISEVLTDIDRTLGDEAKFEPVARPGVPEMSPERQKQWFERIHETEKPFQDVALQELREQEKFTKPMGGSSVLKGQNKLIMNLVASQSERAFQMEERERVEETGRREEDFRYKRGIAEYEFKRKQDEQRLASQQKLDIANLEEHLRLKGKGLDYEEEMTKLRQKWREQEFETKSKLQDWWMGRQQEFDIQKLGISHEQALERIEASKPDEAWWEKPLEFAGDIVGQELGFRRKRDDRTGGYENGK